jgi:hypothetical protein
MRNPFDAHPELQAAVHAARLQFLRVELEVGNAMLDAAAGEWEEDVRASRRDRAEEAHGEVARQLAKGPRLGLAPPELSELAAGLARLKARINTAL